MNSAFESGIEKLEGQLILWEKGLYACYAIAFTMLAHAVVKARENTVLADMIFNMERLPRTTTPFISSQYNGDIFYIMGASWRSVLWMVVEVAILLLAVTLAFHPTWRKFTLAKRLDLVFGYFLAAWVVLLSLGAQNPDDFGNGMNFLTVGSLLLLGLAYWWFRRKKDRAEEAFP
jgi:LPXTG-motif cell wall-anchored protein